MAAEYTRRHSKDEPKMDDSYFNLLSLKHVMNPVAQNFVKLHPKDAFLKARDKSGVSEHFPQNLKNGMIMLAKGAPMDRYPLHTRNFEETNIYIYI